MCEWSRLSASSPAFGIITSFCFSRSDRCIVPDCCGVLICVSLMAHDVEYLLMGLFTFCMFSSRKRQSDSLAHFQIELFDVFLLLCYESCLCVLDTILDFC